MTLEDNDTKSGAAHDYFTYSLYEYTPTVIAGGSTLASSTTYSGGNSRIATVGSSLTIAGGVAQLGGTGGDQLYDGSSVTVTSGAFDTNARSETINNLSLAGTGISRKGALVNDASSGAASLTVSGTTTLTANASVGVTNSAASMTLTSDVTGASTLGKVGAVTLTVISKTTNGIAPGRIHVQGGTLLLGSSNIIAHSTPITLSGGPFATGINGETIGALTLSATSRIDPGTYSLGQLIFANSSAQSWTSAQTFFIDNRRQGRRHLLWRERAHRMARTSARCEELSILRSLSLQPMAERLQREL